jgi:phosphoadenosine phosphosulfate reductase
VSDRIPQPPMSAEQVQETNAKLEKAPAEERVRWALDRFRPEIFLSTSFGAQSAVSLHLVTRQAPDIPVVLIDTGYLFPETYRFADLLVQRLSLNLKVYRPVLTPGWQEARWGKRWEQGLEAIQHYNQFNKVEPMQRALQELNARAWISGLRRQQAKSREELNVLALQNAVVKVHPIIDWTDRQIFKYLTLHDLPYHPLWEKGYVSIGDTHTTRPLEAGMTEEETRFFGLKRECGLHDPEAWSPEL